MAVGVEGRCVAERCVALSVEGRCVAVGVE